MKVVIVDDDVIFMDALKMDLLKHFDVFDEDIIIDTFDDPMELTGHYNIYFIDIDLIKYNGIAIANEIRMKNRNSITVFVSAKEDLVFESFMARPFYFIRKNQYQLDLMMFFKLIDQELRYDVLIPLSYKAVKTQVMISDIVYIETQGHRTTYHTVDNSYHDSRSLKETLKLLPQELFAQVHQSYIANMTYISSYKGDIITMTDGSLINIGQSYKKSFYDAYQRFVLR